MQHDAKILRPKAGVRVVCMVLYLAGFALIWFHLPFGIPDHFKTWIAPAYIVLGGLGLADMLLTRIALGRDKLRIVFGFRSQTIPRAEIDSVTWAAGCGASVILRGGKGVPLPSVGRNAQGLTNTIRAWLKRTEVEL
jgi:hypothetical protein